VIEIMDRPRREHIALYVAFVVITLGNGLAVLVLRRDPSSALAAGSPPGLALFFAAAGALLIAGLVSTLAGQHRLAWCAFAACLCWLAPIWIAWVHGPAIVRSIASMVAPFLLAFVAATAVRGWLVIAGFLGTGLITALLILVRNPFFDPGCWDDCGSTNVFLASSVPELARGLELGWAVFTGVFGLVVVAVSWMQWAVLTRVGRRAQLWLVVPVTASASGLSKASWNGVGVPPAGSARRVWRPSSPKRAPCWLLRSGCCVASALPYDAAKPSSG
jgi:hypothetical protein